MISKNYFTQPLKIFYIFLIKSKKKPMLPASVIPVVVKCGGGGKHEGKVFDGVCLDLDVYSFQWALAF